ncbi:hypothetical protein [Simkania sp.]|uniref:hypothetical protein n=1 Tax=Simkania sp. TaxID=34094 RepID=UPI003B52BF68
MSTISEKRLYDSGEAFLRFKEELGRYESSPNVSLYPKAPFVACVDKGIFESTSTREKLEKIIKAYFPNAEFIIWVDTSKHNPPHQTHLINSDRSCNDCFRGIVEAIQEDGFELQEVDLSVTQNTIEGIEKTPVDLSSGTIHYFPSLQATKESLLVPIQKTLLLCIQRDIKSRHHWPKEYVWFLKQMPTTVPDLIDFLYSERTLPDLTEKEAHTLKSAYELGQDYLTLVSNHYASSRKPVEMKLNPDMAEELRVAYKEVHEILLKLCSPPKDSTLTDSEDLSDGSSHKVVR